MEKALTRLREVDPLPRHPGIGGDSTGSYTTELTEEEQRTGDLTVCTLNIAGLTAVKLHHVLYHIRRNSVDVMVLIDAQLSSQQMKWPGRIAKEQLGKGTVKHTNLVIGERGERWGGIFVIVGPRWGPSLSAFQDDNVGLGILTQISLATKGGPILVLATYWPIRHSTRDVNTTKTNIWTSLAILIQAKTHSDRTPLA